MKKNVLSELKKVLTAQEMKNVTGGSDEYGCDDVYYYRCFCSGIFVGCAQAVPECVSMCF